MIKYNILSRPEISVSQQEIKHSLPMIQTV